MKSDLPYLRHIADSIGAIERYVATGKDVFMADRMIQDAVVRNFEIIGEPGLKEEINRLLTEQPQEKKR